MHLINRFIIVLTLIMLGAMTSAHAQSSGNNVPSDFPNPGNVRVEGNLLIWDAVPNAAGYNIYSTSSDQAEITDATPLTYVTTVVGTTQFPLTFTGNYSVVSFNQDSTLFSNQFATEVQVRFAESETGSAATGIAGSFSSGVFSSTCGSILGAKRCRATCPSDTDEVTYIATGGACAPSEIVPVRATAEPRSYYCEVSEFTAEIKAQVYCSTPN